eukprot:RCo029709
MGCSFVCVCGRPGPWGGDESFPYVQPTVLLLFDRTIRSVQRCPPFVCEKAFASDEPCKIYRFVLCSLLCLLCFVPLLRCGFLFLQNGMQVDWHVASTFCFACSVCVSVNSRAIL